MNWIILLVVVLTLTSRPAHSQPANETVVPPDIKLSSQLRDLKIDLSTARSSHDFVTLRINTLEPPSTDPATAARYPANQNRFPIPFPPDFPSDFR